MAAKFADIEIPQEITELRKEIISNFNQLNNITCVLNDNVFPKIIKSIHYCYQTGILEDKDLPLLQRELLVFLDFIEKLVTTGVNDFGSKCSFYYSFADLEADCICYEYDKNTMLQIWLFPENPIIINNNQLIHQIFQDWIDSKIKYSTLVTKSNDLLKSKVMREWYEQTINMDKVIDAGVNLQEIWTMQKE